MLGWDEGICILRPTCSRITTSTCLIWNETLKTDDPPLSQKNHVSASQASRCVLPFVVWIQVYQSQPLSATVHVHIEDPGNSAITSRLGTKNRAFTSLSQHPSSTRVVTGTWIRRDMALWWHAVNVVESCDPFELHNSSSGETVLIAGEGLFFWYPYPLI